MHLALLTASDDEFHQFVELRIGDLEFRMLLGTSSGEDGEESPLTHTCLIKHILQLGQVLHISSIHTGDDVPNHLLLTGQKTDASHGVLETALMASHPVVVGFIAIEADGHASQSRGTQAFETFLGEHHAVGHHAPRILAFIEFQTDVLDVLASQRFPS